MQFFKFAIFVIFSVETKPTQAHPTISLNARPVTIPEQIQLFKSSIKSFSTVKVMNINDFKLFGN